MGAYALRRLLQLPLVLLGISLVVFLIMALLPGDPALAILGPYATPDALAYESSLFGLLASTEDMREGTGAFLEKRKADFQGR